MKALRYLLIAIIFIGFSSCSKDEANKQIKNSHRIKQVIYESDYSNTKEEFFYENEMLVSVKNFKKNEASIWEESSLMEFEYSSKLIHTKFSEKIDGSDVLVYTIDSKTLNGLITEETLTSLDATKEKSWKCEYQYSGSELTNWERYRDEENSGVYSPHEKGEYIYEEDKLIEYIHYVDAKEGTWQPLLKYVFTCTDKGFSDYTCYSYSQEEEFYKFFLCDYTYTNNLISKSNISIWQAEAESWMEFMSRLYNYNSDGYLTEVMDAGAGVAHRYYEYEEGHGNIESLIYPEIMVLKEPHYKSSREKESYTPFYKKYNNKYFNH
jgi:hypothetical protein